MLRQTANHPLNFRINRGSEKNPEFVEGKLPEHVPGYRPHSSTIAQLITREARAGLMRLKGRLLDAEARKAKVAA